LALAAASSPKFETTPVRKFVASDLLQRDTEASGVAESRRDKGLSTLAAWSSLSWGLFIPLVFAGNVAVATLAWFIVELVMR
jgi:hypothetical protein